MKNYTENDEIELKLDHDIADHYWLKWRYSEPRKFLFIKFYDDWKRIAYYTNTIGFTPDEDPNDDLNWYWRGFSLGEKYQVQEYESLKKKIRTKKELFDYFHVKENMDLYAKHLHEHKLWVDNTNSTIKRLVKQK